MKRNLCSLAAVTIAVMASCSPSVAQSADDILQRLEALEKSDRELKKENAALQQEIKRMKSATQTTSVTRQAQSAKTPSDAYAAAPVGPAYKAAPVGAPATSGWTGFYIGANGGFSQAHLTGPELGFNAQGGFGSVQIGLNYRVLDHWLVGLEQDAWFGDIKGSAPIVGGNTGTVAFKFDTMATFRARIGYIWDSVMLYETAGFALAQANGSIVVTAPPDSVVSVNDHRLMTGFAVGGGVEIAATPNLLLRAEYLYLDFPNKNFFAFPALAGTPMNQSGAADVYMHTVRAGASWLFN